MKCLCCGKELNREDVQELASGWHLRCIRKFFQTSAMPKIYITDEELEKLAEETVAHGFTVTGVQKKLSLHLSQNDEKKLTIVDFPSGYILKPQTKSFSHLPEAEALVMSIADLAGIKTAPHALIRLNSSSGSSYAYITKRMDRTISYKKGTVSQVGLYAMEDFCQLSFRLTEDKYKGSYERVAGIIRKYSEKKMLDLSELYLRLLVCFITGNSDMHLKNFSLIESEPASRQFSLSPAYDLLPVNLVMPEDKEETALTLNGKKRNLRKKDFLAFADSAGLSKKVAIKMMQSIISKDESFIRLVDESLLQDDMKHSMKELIRSRIDRLS